MFATVQDGLALVQLSSPLIALLSIIIFDVPRYLCSTLAMVFFSRSKNDNRDLQRSVSVIISSFNGADTIAATVNSVVRQNAHIVEIIIIDDGSTDDTRNMARHLKGQTKIKINIIAHTQRMGKSASINHAARFAKGDLLLILDDDTCLTSDDDVARLAYTFSDDNVAAAGGNLIIQNSRDSLWTSLQSLEYMISITAGRSFLNIIDALACCSGAFSIFRRTIFMDSGGLNVGPGEDLEITQRLRLLGYKIAFVADAIASTKAPVTLAQLIHQRLRWDRDALNIRLFMYKQLFSQAWYESLGDTLQRLDFIIFEFFPALFFPFYCLYVVYYFQDQSLLFLFGIYIYLLALYIFNIAVVIVSVKEPLSAFDALVVFALPFYQGLMMRCVRIYAFACEIFLHSSHHDDYVPERIRRALYGKLTHAYK